jgi:LacI family transcriptional regulator
MPQPPRVALLIEMSGVHGRRILEGVTQFLRSHRPWTIVLEHRDVGSNPPRWLAAGEVDGVISRWSGPRITEALRGLGAPAVDVSSRHPGFGPPRITTDDRAVGEMAAAHLLERRLRSFLYCGIAGELWSARRRDPAVEE